MILSLSPLLTGAIGLYLSDIIVWDLTNWGRVTHICVSNLTITGSDRRQAIIWTNAGILLIVPLGTNFNEIFIEVHTFSFKKIHLKMSSAKWRPFCLGLNVLMINFINSRSRYVIFANYCLCITHLSGTVWFYRYRFQLKTKNKHTLTKSKSQHYPSQSQSLNRSIFALKSSLGHQDIFCIVDYLFTKQSSDISELNSNSEIDFTKWHISKWNWGAKCKFSGNICPPYDLIRYRRLVSPAIVVCRCPYFRTVAIFREISVVTLNINVQTRMGSFYAIIWHHWAIMR